MGTYISGLDPPGIPFDKFHEKGRLDANDANYVDVIHTDQYVGTSKALGHADFYPNGGSNQNGCNKGLNICSHQRSIALFTNSISPKCHFTAFHCSDYESFQNGKCFTKWNVGRMGHHSDVSKVYGSFYLETGSDQPYCGKWIPGYQSKAMNQGHKKQGHKARP